ncbi:MAG: SpoVA/SpoVAEb family sporulation membrane protein [Oscillospiraceae bacterium]|nr:SpoVA/SpoVAEb family sporulation membrane protein [Oscillospiraceae bacterium]
MNMTNEEYKRYAEKRAPRSQTRGNMLRAFVYGGVICCLGQFFLELFVSLGLDSETAGTACSITMIFFGAALTAAGVYDDIAKRAGAGTLVPITGFANSVAAPALEFKTEGFITGTAAKMFVIAGPVIVYGASAGVVYGLLLLLFRAV